MDQESPALQQELLTMQIITIALVMGVVFFAGIVVFIGGLNGPPTGQFMAILAAGFAAIMTVLHFVVPPIFARSAVDGISSKAEPTVWVGVFQTKTIIAMALLEGAAFFNLVCCIIEHNWWSMTIAGGLVAIMLIGFPTRSRVEHWIENQRMAAEQRERL